jgi:outer membrane protein
MKVTFITILLSLSIKCICQEKKCTSWSLEKCIDIALSKDVSINEAKWQHESSKLDYQSVKLKRLPTLSSSFSGGINLGRSLSFDNTYKNQNITNSNLSISSSIMLFNGFKLRNEIEKDKLNVESSVKNILRLEDHIKIEISLLYLEALLHREYLEVVNNSLSTTKAQLKTTTNLVNVGTIHRKELLDLKTQIAGDKLKVSDAKKELQSSLLKLKQKIGLSFQDEFSITHPEDIEWEKLNTLKVSDIELLAKNSPKYQQNKIELLILEKELKIAKANSFPKIQFNISSNTSYHKNISTNNDILNRPFSEQIRENVGHNFNLSINIPIFNHKNSITNIKKAKINYETTQHTHEDLFQQLIGEIYNAYLKVEVAKEKYQFAKEAVKSSKEAYRVAEDLYQLGELLFDDYNKAKDKFIIAKSEEIQAKYELIFNSKVLDVYNKH